MYTAKIHRKILFDRKMGLLVNGALCFSTSKHNGKSGTSFWNITFIRNADSLEIGKPK